ncbi:hypothetical protein [Hymenobacter nivis]|uniref:Uncharacterized protein n=1 Tax=Hymenobacter nivis TaxID=1850093 RepID=A0A2Z3GF90_9BACT|nr:hypothetical protein [Hymenobacter nivis]AWM31458.1 hypothetical protein DDQ68_00830 [Hymenobacter nivis]
MKRFAAVFLSLLMLLGSCVPENDLGELAKLPELVKHYRFHHSAAGGGLTLGEFLVEHYGAGTKQHFGCICSARHQQDHQGLPLHGGHDCAAGAFLVAQGPHLGWAPRVPRAVPGPRSAWVALYRFQPSASLLQPPRA